VSRRAGALAIAFVWAASSEVFAAESTPVAANRFDASGSTSRPAMVPRADPRSPATIVTPGEDVPDPFVVLEGGTYYMYSTGEIGVDAPQIALRTSTDRVHWSQPVDALPNVPRWAEPGFTWAPDVRKIDGRYVMYLTARVRDLPQSTQCIGTAVADTPMGPFVSYPKQLVCQIDHRGSIDPRTFVDSDGTLWLHWKSDDNAHLDGSEHTSIYAQRLGRDGLHLIGERSAILTADRQWEGRIVEAPHMVRAAGHYWLFYSGNWFNQPVYAVGVAVCAGPAGPCLKPFPSPFLWSNTQGAGPGEGSLFKDGDGWWTVYAPWSQQFEGFVARPVALARVAFTRRGPYLAAF
jgi:beta-xylosidase